MYICAHARVEPIGKTRGFFQYFLKNSFCASTLIEFSMSPLKRLTTFSLFCFFPRKSCRDALNAAKNSNAR